MLGERFGHRQYATTCPESGGTRASGECLVEPRKADGRDRALALRHRLERGSELRPQIEAASNMAKLDDFGTTDMAVTSWARCNGAASFGKTESRPYTLLSQ
jgi:hypothetical protein